MITDKLIEIITKPSNIAYATAVILFGSVRLSKKTTPQFFTVYYRTYFQISVLALLVIGQRELWDRFGTSLGALIIGCLCCYLIEYWEIILKEKPKYKHLYLLVTWMSLCIYASHTIVVSSDLLLTLSTTTTTFLLTLLPFGTYRASKYIIKLFVACSYMMTLHAISYGVAALYRYKSTRHSSKR